MTEDVIDTAKTVQIEPRPIMEQGATTSTPMVIYILYVVGFFFPLAALVGVIMAHVCGSNENNGLVVNSHYSYLKRTFWWGLVWAILGAVLAIVLVGYLILLGMAIWTIYRIVKGLSAWNRMMIIE